MLRSQDLRSLYRVVFLLLLFVAGVMGASTQASSPQPTMGLSQKVIDSFYDAGNKVASYIVKGAYYMLWSTSKIVTDLFQGNDICSKKVSSPTTVVVAFALAMLITLLLAVFRYFLRVLASHELQGVDPKAELTAGIYHVAESFIVLFLVLITYSILVNSNQVYPYLETAKEFSANMTAHMFSQIVLMGIIGTITYSVYNSFEVDWPLTASSQLYIPIAFGKTLQPIIDTYGIIAQFVAIAAGEWFGKYLLLCFIGKYALTLFLPLGLVFRSLKLTEGFGNAIIAFTLSVFFFYPILLSINAAVFKAVEANPSLYLLGMGSDFMKVFSPLIGIYLLSVFIHGGSAVLAGMGTLLTDGGITAAIRNFFGGLGSGFIASLFAIVGGTAVKIFFVVMAMEATIYIVEWLVILIGVFSFLFTVLNIYLTIGLAYMISKALGTPLDFSALMRMI